MTQACCLRFRQGNACSKRMQRNIFGRALRLRAKHAFKVVGRKAGYKQVEVQSTRDNGWQTVRVEHSSFQRRAARNFQKLSVRQVASRTPSNQERDDRRRGPRIFLDTGRISRILLWTAHRQSNRESFEEFG